MVHGKSSQDTRADILEPYPLTPDSRTQITSDPCVGAILWSMASSCPSTLDIVTAFRTPSGSSAERVLKDSLLTMNASLALNVYTGTFTTHDRIDAVELYTTLHGNYMQPVTPRQSNTKGLTTLVEILQTTLGKGESSPDSISLVLDNASELLRRNERSERLDPVISRIDNGAYWMQTDLLKPTLMDRNTQNITVHELRKRLLEIREAQRWAEGEQQYR